MATKKTSEKFDHVMIDLETLDTVATGVILSIGAVKFNEDEISDDAFYRIISIDSNLAEGRTISASTIRFWMSDKVDQAARAVFNAPNQVTLDLALAELRMWIGTGFEADHIKVWGNGADFDISMLAHAYGTQGTPWQFYNVRCFRTLKSSDAGRKVPKPENKGAHNALYDALAQAQHLQALWAKGIGK